MLTKMLRKTLFRTFSRRFSKEHEWVEKVGNEEVYSIGITDYA